VCALDLEASGELGELAGRDGADVCIFRFVISLPEGGAVVPINPQEILTLGASLTIGGGASPSKSERYS